MKITNKANLPEALVNAVSRERHNEKGHYSATTLLKGACEVVLMDRHFDEIEVDASDSIWAIFGSAVHSIFENQNDDSFKEESFEVKIGDSVVTGKVDSYDLENEILVDWKTASVWKVQFQDFDDWRKQGLIYSWLLKQNGLNVKKCRFIALLKDHSKSKARFDANYPQSPCYVYEFDVTDKDLAEIEVFIKEKLEMIRKAEEQADEDLEPCSKDERWATDDKFAVMKEGRKTALKLFDTREDAEKMLESLDDKHWLQERKGEGKKCVDYCVCRDFCPFYNKSINAVGD